MYGAWRASVWAEAASGNAQAFPVHGTWGPRGPSTVPSLLAAARRCQKKRFNYFGGKPNIIDESRRRAKREIMRKKSVARPPKEGFHSFCNSKIEMKSQRATFRSRHAHHSSAERHRRSDSGAAVRRTRGGELGRAPATRRVAQFSAGCGQKQIGSAFAVL